jgi:hypothetical protein
VASVLRGRVLSPLYTHALRICCRTEPLIPPRVIQWEMVRFIGHWEVGRTSGQCICSFVGPRIDTSSPLILLANYSRHWYPISLETTSENIIT